MVTQVQAIHRRDSVDIAARFRERAAELRERVLVRMADAIINESPIDTGTYILAHRARAVAGGLDEAGARSSHGRPRGVPDAQFRNLARGNLHRSVSSAAVSAATEVFFRNVSEHADIVEYLHGHAVYAQVRNAAPAFIRDAATELGMQVQ
jgi:hypothetical protein